MPTKYIKVKEKKTGLYKRTETIREKMRKAQTGKKHTEIEKQKISDFMKRWHQSHIHPLKGKKHSLETRQKMRNSAHKGPANYNWKGGITLQVRTFRKSIPYRHWRERILSRDNFTCQKCGSKNKLEIHHIYSVKENPQLRLSIKNGITLCKKCHKETDNYGNRKKN